MTTPKSPFCGDQIWRNCNCHKPKIWRNSTSNREIVPNPVLSLTPNPPSLFSYLSLSLSFAGDGTIDFEEFCELMKNKMKGLDADEEIREAFKVFDKNGDGFVEVAELRQVLQGLGEPLSEAELQEMIKEADTDGDGRISYQEYGLFFSF